MKELTPQNSDCKKVLILGDMHAKAASFPGGNWYHRSNEGRYGITRF
jgi:hypothetical protein